MLRNLIAAVVVVAVGAACGGSNEVPSDAMSAEQSLESEAGVVTETSAADAQADDTNGEEAAVSEDPATQDSAEASSAEPDAAESAAEPEDATASESEAAPAVVVEPFEVSEDVPDIEMLDAATGEQVNLRSVVTGDTALMFWFWSPF